MEANNTNLTYTRQNKAQNKELYRVNNNAVGFKGAEVSANQSAPAAVSYLYNYNSAPLYQYPAYSPQTQTTDINASMKSQLMPIASEGYKEVQTFDAPFLNKGKLYQLDNGQNVVIIPKKGPTTIKTFVKVGSFNEEKNRGISHYIEHNLFNGSSHLGPNEFVEKVVSMGGQYNASTNTNCTDYFIKSPMHRAGDFEKFMEMHADMLNSPKFTEPMLEKERGPVISEIQMYEDDPNDKAYNLMLKNLFGIKADYQGLIAGSSKTIANVTRKDVVDYYNEWYRPDNMTTVIVGEVNPEQAIKTASKLFNQRKAEPDTKAGQHFYEPVNLTQNPVRADFKSAHVDTAVLNMAFAGPKNSEIKDTVATLALCNALTGYENARLTKTFKEFNTAGAMDINLIHPDLNAPQLITLGATFTPGKEEDGLKAVYSTMQSMATQPLNEKEMFVVKNKLKDNFTQMSENSMSVANLAGQAMSGYGSISAYTGMLDQIEKLTPQDIQSAAQKYLDLNRTSIVMVHPESQKVGGKPSFGSSPDTDKFKLKNVKEYDLPNNLRVAINDDPDSIRTSAHLSVQSDEPHTLKPGVAEILTSMLNKGTTNYSEDQMNNIKDTYNLGLYAEAEGDCINLSAGCAKENLPMALQSMKEILFNADLSPDKFKKAKEEIRVQYSSTPKNPSDKALESLYPDHQIGNTTRKVLANLDNVTLQDVQDLHAKILANSQG